MKVKMAQAPTPGLIMGNITSVKVRHSEAPSMRQASTISVGIATMQGENSTDFGLLMAGSALASVPIIIVFLVFQKYFTKGITMGAVKG